MIYRSPRFFNRKGRAVKPPACQNIKKRMVAFMGKGKRALIIVLAVCLCLWSCAPKGEKKGEQAEPLSETGMKDAETVTDADREKEAEASEAVGENVPQEEKSGFEEKSEDTVSPDGNNYTGRDTEAADTGRTAQSGRENRSRDPKKNTDAPPAATGEKGEENGSGQEHETSSGEDPKQDQDPEGDPAGEEKEEATEEQFIEAEGEADSDF